MILLIILIDIKVVVLLSQVETVAVVAVLIVDLIVLVVELDVVAASRILTITLAVSTAVLTLVRVVYIVILSAVYNEVFEIVRIFVDVLVVSFRNDVAHGVFVNVCVVGVGIFEIVIVANSFAIVQNSALGRIFSCGLRIVADYRLTEVFHGVLFDLDHRFLRMYTAVCDFIQFMDLDQMFSCASWQTTHDKICCSMPL